MPPTFCDGGPIEGNVASLIRVMFDVGYFLEFFHLNLMRKHSGLHFQGSQDLPEEKS